MQRHGVPEDFPCLTVKVSAHRWLALKDFITTPDMLQRKGQATERYSKEAERVVKERPCALRLGAFKNVKSFSQWEDTWKAVDQQLDDHEAQRRSGEQAAEADASTAGFVRVCADVQEPAWKKTLHWPLLERRYMEEGSRRQENLAAAVGRSCCRRRPAQAPGMRGRERGSPVR